MAFPVALASRMLLGLGLLLLYLRLRRQPLYWHHQHYPAYLVSGLSVFFAMTIVYWSAQYIPSGWIALLFALAPFMTGIISWRLQADRVLSLTTIIALLLAFAGLLVIFAEGLELGSNAWKGILGIIVSTAIHSFAAVLLNGMGTKTSAVATTVGGLIIASPLFILLAVFFAAEPGLPTDRRAWAAVTYLAIFASAIGFPLYFYILQHLSSTTVSLLTLITPVTALLLGQYLNDEVIVTRIWIGGIMILVGLGLYALSQQHANKKSPPSAATSTEPSKP